MSGLPGGSRPVRFGAGSDRYLPCAVCIGAGVPGDPVTGLRGARPVLLSAAKRCPAAVVGGVLPRVVGVVGFLRVCGVCGGVSRLTVVPAGLYLRYLCSCVPGVAGMVRGISMVLFGTSGTHGHRYAR